MTTVLCFTSPLKCGRTVHVCSHRDQMQDFCHRMIYMFPTQRLKQLQHINNINMEHQSQQLRNKDYSKTPANFYKTSSLHNTTNLQHLFIKANNITKTINLIFR